MPRIKRVGMSPKSGRNLGRYGTPMTDLNGTEIRVQESSLATKRAVRVYLKGDGTIELPTADAIRVGQAARAQVMPVPKRGCASYDEGMRQSETSDVRLPNLELCLHMDRQQLRRFIQRLQAWEQTWFPGE